MYFITNLSGSMTTISPYLQGLVFGAILILFFIVFFLIVFTDLRFQDDLSPLKIITKIDKKDSLSNAVQKAYAQALCLNDSNEKTPETGENKQVSNSISQINNNDLFINDAVYQYGISIFESKFLEPYENLINLLPPLGFLGTIIGMMILFIGSNGEVKHELSSAGMGTALLSTIIALFLYIFFEMIKLFIQKRAKTCIQESINIARKVVKNSPKEENLRLFMNSAPTSGDR